MLSDDQLRCFASDGYIVVPGVVSEALTTAADAEIDTLMALEPTPDDGVGKRSFFRRPDELPAADAALRESGALEIAEGLVAPRRLNHGLDHIQIAVSSRTTAIVRAAPTSTATVPSRSNRIPSPCSRLSS